MKKTLAVAALALLLASCGSTGNKSGPGILFTQTTDGGYADNSVSPSKTGKACSTRVLALIATGDASVQAAKNNGNISKVASIDTEYFNILGLYGTACTVVKGN
jgi:hypothetical protein